MRNIKLTIAYDGYSYHGWQFQPDKPTIQGEIESALQKLTNQKIQIIGASRTDAGVSALGQVANFQLDSSIPTENFARALNPYLPDEIFIIEAQEVDENFNSRFNALNKQYCYRIHNGLNKPVLDIHHCWHYPYPLDVCLMQKAAQHLIGTHDFKSFASSGDQRQDSTRTIFKCDILQQDQWIDITVQGDGFLYNMVRNIVGTLVEIGRKRWTPDYIQEILTAKDRRAAGILAPPNGLCLMWIQYD